MMLKDTTKGWKRAVLTALMAYALVLQTVLVSLSGAAHAAEALGPRAVHCFQDAEPQPDHAPSSPHDGLCCTLSCHSPGPPVGPAPGFVLSERIAPVILAARAPTLSSIKRISSQILPVGSRAPPRLG